MAAGTYSAGTAFLQVVPSFLGVQEAAKAEAAKLGGAFESAVEKALPEGVAKGAKAAEPEATKAGVEWAGAFASAAEKRLRAAFQSLPKAKPDVELTEFDAKIAEMRERIQSVHDAHVKGSIDTAQFLAEIEVMKRELKSLQNEAPRVDQFIDLQSAEAQIEGILASAEKARLAGFQAGSSYGGAFTEAVRARLETMVRSLPQINLDADPSPAERAINVLRAELEVLRDQHIKAELDDSELLARLQYVRAQLEELASTTTEPNIKFNAEKVIADIKKFGDVDAPREMAKAAEKAGDAFDARLHEKVKAAISKLPEVEIGADTSDADIAIAFVRSELESIRSQHIKAELDDETAIAKIRELKLYLDELARKSPSIRVRTDAAAAIAELVAVLGVAEKVDKSNPTVKVKDDGGTNGVLKAMQDLTQAAGLSHSQIAFVLTLGASLGTVIVPAAAAAAAAIGAIGTAAAAAGSGIGVAILGFSGISTAVQALESYQKQTSKSAASLQTSENGVANALDGVASAERSLSNTREEVAYAAQRAAQTVKDAQLSVTDAERNALAARKELTAAYQDAVRAQEDQVLAIRANALAQQQANLDVKKAKQQLDAVLANPRATQDERDQARITYEQQVLQLDDLTVKQKRLQQDKEAADKAGIEGSDKVQAAQEKVRAATESVSKAQEQLAQAITAQQQQQRQGAFQLAQAQQSLAAAQRQVEQASTRAGVAGGAALLNLQNAMANLGPAGQKFARFVFGLKGDFLSLRDTAQTGMLPGVQRGIEALLPYMAQLQRFIGNVANALGGMFEEGVRQMQLPTWQKFFGLVEREAVPALEGMFKFATSASRGVAALILAMAPFNAPIGTGLVNMAESFARWAEKLSTTSGFQKFVAYVRTNGPHVLDLFKQMGIFVEHIVIAAAPIGADVVKIFESLFKTINSWPIGTVTLILRSLAGIATGVLAATVGLKILKGALAFGEFISTVYGWISKASTATKNWATNLSTATQQVQTFGFGIQGARSATSGLTNEFKFFQGLSGKIGDAAKVSIGGLSTALGAARNSVGLLSTAARNAGTIVGRAMDLPQAAVQRYRDLVTTSRGEVGLWAKAHETASGVISRAMNLPGAVVKRYTDTVTTATGEVGLLAKAHEVAGTAVKGFTNLGSTVMNNFRTVTGTAAKAADGWIAKIGTGMVGAASGLKNAVGGLVGALGGPWGLALTAAGAAIAIFTARAIASKQQADSLKNSLVGLAGAYDQGKQALDDYLKEQLKSDPNFRKMVKNSQDVGVSLKDLTDAAHGNKDALGRVNSTYDDQINRLSSSNELLKANATSSDGYLQALLDQSDVQQKYGVTLGDRIRQLKDEKKGVNDAADGYKDLEVALGIVDDSSKSFNTRITEIGKTMSDQNASVDDFHNSLNDLGTLLPDVTDRAQSMAEMADRIGKSNLDASSKASLFKDVLNDLGNAADTKGPVFDSISSVFQSIAGSALSASDKTSLLKQSLDQLYGSAISQNEADEALARTQDSLATQLSASSAGFDLKTAKTKDDKEAVLQNRDALEAALLATRDSYVANLAQGDSLQEATDKHNAQIDAIKREIPQNQQNSQAVQDLINKYGAIPDSKTTKVAADGLGEAIEKLVEAHVINKALEAQPHWDRSLIESEVKLELLAIQGRQASWADKLAEGGRVGGWSPHQKADNIHAMLTAGEWVHPVAAVRYYGPQVMEAMRTQAVPRELFAGMVPGFADGGLATTWPVNIPLSFKVPDVGALWQQWQSAIDAQQQGFGQIPAAIAANLYGWIQAAVQIAGVPASWAGGPGAVGLWTLVMRESGGNVRAQNNWDENARRGTPSQGLAQVIRPTFESYRDRRLSDDPFDPVANLVAALRYIRARYGSIFNVQQANPNLPPRGYALGGLVRDWTPKLYDSGGLLAPGWNPPIYNGTGRPEPVLNPTQWSDISTAARVGQSGSGNTYVFPFRDTTLTPSKLRAMQDQDDLRARAGRRR